MEVDLEIICEKFGITDFKDMEDFDWDSESDWTKESWCNYSMSAGRDMIKLGLYDDPELRLFSFFHELGHTQYILPPYNEWPYGGPGYKEALAWKLGIELAKEYEVVFSAEAKSWAIEQLSTYFYEGVEGSNPKYFESALETSGLKE